MAPPSTRSRPSGLERFIPRRELRPFVDLIWQYNGLVQAHTLERVLPTGNMLTGADPERFFVPPT